MVTLLFVRVRNPRILFLAAILLVALVGFLTYARNLDDLFTASDTIPLIETARIASVGDLARIFSERLMEGTSFEGRFFRPVSVLSFSLDYAIWGLNPFGYHLLNLILHMAASLMVFFVARALTRNNLRIALLAGIIFATHPVLVETVPAIARRQDILEFLFCSLAYLMFLKNEAGNRPSSRMHLASLAFFFLALCSKETAAYLPVLIALHVFVFRNPVERSFGDRLRQAGRTAGPYLIPLIVFAIWRTAVLQGPGTGFFGQSSSRICLSYVAGLSYPQDFLQLGQSLGPLGRLFIALGAASLLGLLFRYSRLDPAARRVVRIALFWLAQPLAILLVAHCFDFRNLYTSVAPFSILVAAVLVSALQGIGHRLRASLNGKNTTARWSPLCQNNCYTCHLF